jgi:hypothetical protein
MRTRPIVARLPGNSFDVWASLEVLIVSFDRNPPRMGSFSVGGRGGVGASGHLAARRRGRRGHGLRLSDLVRRPLQSISAHLSNETIYEAENNAHSAHTRPSSRSQSSHRKYLGTASLFRAVRDADAWLSGALVLHQRASRSWGAGPGVGNWGVERDGRVRTRDRMVCMSGGCRSRRRSEARGSCESGRLS